MTEIHNFQIEDRKIGTGHPCYIIAEISCNHNGNMEEAKAIIQEAAKAGADAVKLQTYTPDTITRNFQTQPKGTMWEKTDLHSLYQKAYTPWEWYGELKQEANRHNLQIFSSPFDETAVDFLVDQSVPALKIASFEVVDTKLLEKAAKTNLPIIISNGMTDYLELKEAVDTLRYHGCEQLAILHCNSGYPADFDECNLNTIPAIESLFGCVTGLSDHTLFENSKTLKNPLAHIAPLEAVKLGAKIIEVHLQLDRAQAKDLFEKNEGGFDWAFSREPAELAKMISMIRTFEKQGKVSYNSPQDETAALRTHGNICFEPTQKELASRKMRPSLWITQDMNAGDTFKFSAENKVNGNFDSIRPGGGLHIRYADLIQGQKALRPLKAGQPMNWSMIDLKTLENPKVSSSEQNLNKAANSGQ